MFGSTQGEFFVQLASGLSVLLLVAIVAGARRWAKGLGDRLDRLDTFARVAGRRLRRLERALRVPLDDDEEGG